MDFVQRLVLALIIVPSIGWMTLAIYFHVPKAWARLPVALLFIGAMSALFLVVPWVPWALLGWLCVLLAVLAWWHSLRPGQPRDWAPGMERWPRVEVDGDEIRIRDFRNFDYSRSGQVAARYEERTFHLSKLRSLDYFLSHILGPTVAHTLVSFGFDDGQYLAVSIEARRGRNQRYSPLAGLFRSYELMYVLGDERDIVRLRTEIRHERVYLYRVHLGLEKIRLLLLDYLERSEDLAIQPQWYNSLTSNCTTNLFFHSHREVRWWLKPSIYLNGLSARALFGVGALADSLPFKELRTRSAIHELAETPADSVDFSRQIRAQMV